jgi:hypothetical protein
MSLSKPEINYDTALYALQENVVLKQRLEEHSLQIEKLEANHASQLACENLRRTILESDKRLYQRRVEKQYKEIEALTQELNNKPHWIFNTILCFLIVDFIFSVWIFCQIPFTK